MKPLTMLLLTCSLLLGADNWRFVKEQGGFKYFANSDISVIKLVNENVARIQSKVVFPRGAVSVTTYYLRMRENHWQSAMKEDNAFHVNGTLRSHKVVSDSQLEWIAADSSNDDTWITLLNQAAALLKAAK